MSIQFQSLHVSFLALIVLAPLAGCDLGQKNLGDENADAATESGSDTSSVLVCGDISDPGDCNSASNDEIYCAWKMIDRAVRTGDACEITQVGYCFQEELVGETAAGCEVGLVEGCPDSNPTYKVTSEGVLLGAMCGGTAEPGFSGCTSGTAASADPPECACACELAP